MVVLLIVLRIVLQESEGEDAEASRVTLPDAAPGRAGKALAGRQSRVRLHEVGPRLELEIVKVSQGCVQWMWVAPGVC
jgi:hypothetical protein